MLFTEICKGKDATILHLTHEYGFLAFFRGDRHSQYHFPTPLSHVRGPLREIQSHIWLAGSAIELSWRLRLKRGIFQEDVL
jgi:hypothetical protein